MAISTTGSAPGFNQGFSRAFTPALYRVILEKSAQSTNVAWMFCQDLPKFGHDNGSVSLRLRVLESTGGFV